MTATRHELACLPTPLQAAADLAVSLGGHRQLFIKRDDLTGFGVAGNKARPLERLLAEALDGACDVLVTGGGPDSNFVAAAALAARVNGLACEVVVPAGASLTHPSQLALAVAFGASIVQAGSPDRSLLGEAILHRADELRRSGQRPYPIPKGGSSVTGTRGFYDAAIELDRQLTERGLAGATVVLPTGSGGSQAGLVAGSVALGRRLRVLGAGVTRPVPLVRARVLELARGCAAETGTEVPGESDVVVQDLRATPAGGPDPADLADLVLGSTGLLLDPVYGAKALVLLASTLAEDGDGPVVYWHTGGLPASLAQLTQQDRATA
jgi:D-cysteine desulfhydrase